MLRRLFISLPLAAALPKLSGTTREALLSSSAAPVSTTLNGRWLAKVFDASGNFRGETWITVSNTTQSIRDPQKINTAVTFDLCSWSDSVVLRDKK